MISFLVALREDPPGHRTRLFDFVRARLEREFPDDELVIASDDGEDPFHKTLALNRAAHEAIGDVFCVLDADTWCDPRQIRIAAAALREDPFRWWKPWREKLKLNEAATEELLALGPEWNGELDPRWRFENRNTFWAAPPMLISRKAWHEVGGMDERIRGWGGDDEALSYALRGLYGPGDIVQGQALHLWHPRPLGRSGRDRWAGQDAFGPNMPIVSAYRRASRKREHMQALIEARMSASPAVRETLGVRSR